MARQGVARLSNVAWLGFCQGQLPQQHHQQLRERLGRPRKEPAVRKLSAMRRVVPPGYRVYELELVGVTPYLMSSGEADRESDTYIAYRQLSKKRGKTVEDESRLRELEWYTRIYYDEKIGCYVPGKNVKEMLREAATKWRKGEDVKRSLIIPEYRIPLIYEGSRKPADLWKAGFSFVAMVANAGAGSGRVERCRPCFDEWAIKTEVAFDPEDLSDHELELFVSRSEKYGLGDYRPDFGSFKASLTFLRVQREDAKANGAKPRDQRVEAANAVRTRALMGTA
jgi:hypothetical protein